MKLTCTLQEGQVWIGDGEAGVSIAPDWLRGDRAG
jgi:hypothetical protein